jgi:aminoglycoside phosphotransferase (APT) family kinase protein
LRGFDADNPLKVCEPVAYFPEWNLLLRSKANGVQLAKMLARSRGSLKLYLTRAAKWLAKLHRTRTSHTRGFSVKEEEEILDGWARRLDMRMSLRGIVGDMKNRIVEGIRPVQPESFTLIHGDFHPKNIFVDSASLTAIDFDQSCIFDPAKDVGYFIAEFFVQRALKKRRYERAPDALGLREHFVSEYAGRMSREFLDRVASYEASSYLEHLNYRVLMGEFDLLDFRHWLGEAEKCLQRVS